MNPEITPKLGGGACVNFGVGLTKDFPNFEQANAYASGLKDGVAYIRRAVSSAAGIPYQTDENIGSVPPSNAVKAAMQSLFDKLILRQNGYDTFRKQGWLNGDLLDKAILAEATPLAETLPEGSAYAFMVRKAIYYASGECIGMKRPHEARLDAISAFQLGGFDAPEPVAELQRKAGRR